MCVSPIFFRERQVIAAAALRHRAMTMFGLREFVEAGGLLSYGASKLRSARKNGTETGTGQPKAAVGLLGAF